MNTHPQDSIVHILRADGRSVGAGFVLRHDGLIVTCAHIVIQAGVRPGENIFLTFLARPSEKKNALVDVDHWRDPAREDVAFLHLQGDLPEEVCPLPLCSSTNVESEFFCTFGFPELNLSEGMMGTGEILGKKLQDGASVLQLRSQEVTQGFSGAPIWLQGGASPRAAIGMITSSMENKEVKIENRKVTFPSDRNWRFLNTSFATPSEVICEIFPGLQIASECPYHPLTEFTEDDAPFFYGREAFIEGLLERLRSYPPFLAVFGPSGSGKSSVVRAGLIPKLREGALLVSDHWKIALVRPVDDPFQLQENLPSPINASPVFLQATNWLQQSGQMHRFVLIVDQFEELFTAKNVMPEMFVAKLIELLEYSPKVTVILVMRNDFYSQFVGQDALRNYLDQSKGAINIPETLTRSELEAIIRKPAQRAHLFIQDGLVDLLMKDTIEEGRREARSTILPLLEFTLARLWEKRQHETLTLDAYNSMHGLRGEFTMKANIACDELRAKIPAAYQQVIPRIFTDLVYIGDENVGIPNSRQRKLLRALTRNENEKDLILQIVDELVNARLLVKRFFNNEITVEIVHDVLINEWEYLKGWIDNNRAFLIWHQKLEHSMQEWVATHPHTSVQQEEDTLLRGEDLLTAEKWLNERQVELSEPEQKFIRASRDRLYKIEQQRRKEVRRLRFFLTALSIFSVVVILLGLLAGIAVVQANWQANNARLQSKIAFSHALAAQSGYYLQKQQFDTALLLSVEGYHTHNDYETRNTLLEAINQSSHIQNLVYDPRSIDNNPVTSLAFSKDDQFLFSSRADGSVASWNTQTKQYSLLIKPISNSDISNTMLSPDGSILAFWDLNGLWLWSTRTGKQIVKITNNSVETVAFSPDSRTLAIIGSPGIQLWDITTTKPLGLLLISDQKVHSEGNLLIFSPDGKWLAMSVCTEGISDNGGNPIYCGPDNILLWDAKTGKRIGMPLTGYQFGVTSLAFSPNGRILASGAADGTIVLWNTETQKPLANPLTGHTNLVESLAFSPDGSSFASGGIDKSIRIWDIATNTSSSRTFLGQQSDISALTFSHDGRHLVSGGGNSSIASDNRLIFWNISQNNFLYQTLDSFDPPNAFNSLGYMLTNDINGNLYKYNLSSNFAEPIKFIYDRNFYNSGAISSDGKTIALLDKGNDINLWDTVNNKLIALIKTDMPLEDKTMIFSPNNQMFAFITSENTIDLWDVKTGHLIGHISGSHDSTIETIAFSPDSTVLAIGSLMNITLWDLRKAVPRFSLNGTDSLELAYNTDGSILAAKSDKGIITLWNINTREKENNFLLNTNAPFGDMALSPDENILATISNNVLPYFINLWDVEADEPFVDPLPSAYPILKLFYGPHGKLIISVNLGHGGTALVMWNTDPAFWSKQACTIANRNFTQVEWNKFMQGELYHKICPET